MRRFALSFSCLLALACTAQAQPSTPLTLQQIMADPDWIGPGVEDAWWRWDGRAIDFNLKREGESIRDTFRVGIDGASTMQRIDGGERAQLDGEGAIYSRDRRRSVFVRNGDVFVRDLSSGALTQLTRSNARESRPQWSDDGTLIWRQGNDWYRWDGRIVAQAASPQAADNPGTPPKADDLRDRQLRLMDTLRNEVARREAARKQDEAWRSEDPTRAPAPLYLGKNVAIVDRCLAVHDHLLVRLSGARLVGGNEGRPDVGEIRPHRLRRQDRTAMRDRA